MKTITIDELVEISQPGDLLLTSNPDGLGTVIRWFQELQGDPAIYTHIAIIPDGFKTTLNLLEANGTLNYHSVIQYCDKRVCLIRHTGMTQAKYRLGFINIVSDIGKKYPYYRLILHAIDNFSNRILRAFHVKPLVHVSKLNNYDNFVCSEWAAKFISSCQLFIKKILGANPDDFHDWSQQYPSIWKTVIEGKLSK